jgi:hypothetical protein
VSIRSDTKEGSETMICCICGFNKKHGIIFGKITVFSKRSFVCVECAYKPYLFFEFKPLTVDGENFCLNNFEEAKT